ncbi:Hspbap1 [Symbiodinium natans]|uniref:Hspbap1 protein n=1 Tax=Symbiodinium natans TaxID=878477 RepID=A0A812QH12_9DINO|nr:Hspbap1 [Symbiodinium natans]
MAAMSSHKLAAYKPAVEVDGSDGCPVPLSELKEPLVLKGALRACTWPALRWGTGLQALKNELGDRLVSLRFGPRSCLGQRTSWEGQCERLSDIRLGEFCAWLSGEEVGSIPFDASSSWGYCAYQHFEAMFKDIADSNRAAADFSRLLPKEKFPISVPGAPTLWLGSQGARTPCHQDAYGHNLVAQMAGEKLWLLFPPSSTWLGPHRLPYEDSSTFTDVDPFIELPPGCSGVVVALKPGDVLAVPQHWFHAVECTSDWSLSLNQWLHAKGDEAQRVHEAVARCLATPLVECRFEEWWLNPDEELLDTVDNVDYLASALKAASDDHEDVTPEAVQAALLRAATHPEVPSTVTCHIETSSSSHDP